MNTKEEKYEDACEFEEDDYVIKCSKLYSFKLLDIDADVELRKCTGKELTDLMPSLFKYQRALDGNHVFSISSSLPFRKRFYHNFIIVNNSLLRTIEIFDGQHRFQSLRNISDTSRKQITCYLSVYNIESDDEPYLTELFYDINQIKGTTLIEKKHQINCGEISKKIRDLFGTYHSTLYKIVDTPQHELKRSDEWKLSFHALKTELEKRNVTITVEELYKKLESFNEFCHSQCYVKDDKTKEKTTKKTAEFFSSYFNIKDTSKIGQQLQHMCVKYKFFLGYGLKKCLDTL